MNLVSKDAANAESTAGRSLMAVRVALCHASCFGHSPGYLLDAARGYWAGEISLDTTWARVSSVSYLRSTPKPSTIYCQLSSGRSANIANERNVVA